MKRILSFLMALCCMLSFTPNVWSQETLTVNGTVLDEEKKLPLEGVTIRVQGTKIIAKTSENGMFSLKGVPVGATIVFSSVGFDDEKVVVKNGNNLTVNMRSNANDLEEVVVAMDLKRKPRELGFSNQRVTGKEIQETQRENFINSLQGRVAGLSITPTTGLAGASSSIVLRGFNSLSLSNQPLFVIDGIIVDNQTLDENSNGGSGVGLASDRPNRNNDYSNRMSDLNPNDIESVTVLKGPEATALYGSQASSGAIVITTRKAKNGKLGIQYDNSFRMQEITRFPEMNNDFDHGTNGASSNIFRYFGAPYAEGTRKFDNVRNFFRAGFTQTHNIGVDFGTKKSVFRFSGSYLDQYGVIPNNRYTRLNFRLSNTTKIGKYIEVMPSINYIGSENKKPLRSGGGYMNSLIMWPVDDDIRNFQDPSGGKRALFSANANSDFDNPFWNVYNNRSGDVTDRYIASLGININPTKWLSLSGRFGYDTYKTDGFTIYHPQSFYISSAVNGTLDNYYRRYKGYNHTITATAKKSIGQFNGRAMVGTMWQDYETRMFSVTGNGLSVVGNTDSSNTSPNTRVRLLRNNFGEYNRSVIRQFAYFGEFSVNWKNQIFLTYTHRFEQASTLPEANRKYNYPGASVSAILSDIIPAIKKTNVINYWKVRSSVASTARLNAPYSTQSVFVNNLASGNGFSYGFTNANPNLKPERQNTYEIGTEMKFFKNRIGLDVTYYNTLVKDQIIENFRLSYGTGFVLNTQNAGSTRNQGVEIVLDVNPIAKKDFNWNIRLNFNRMWNEVLSLPASVTEYYLADTWIYLNARGGVIQGNPTTTITAYGYQRNTRGDILISPTTGLPVNDPIFRIRGDRNPDFTLGTLNSFRYKNWNLSFLWDLKVGGDVFNGTHMFMTINGKSKQTADRMTPRVIQGVLQDGRENTANPTVNNIVITPYYNEQFYGSVAMPEEAYIEKDVNWFRLRDLSLSYMFTQKQTRLIKQIKTLSAFVTVNDLILITNYTGADPAVNGTTAGARGVGGFGFDYGSLATPISVNVGIRAGL